MAMRKSEWSALIKPIIDREGAKNDAKALARELSDILDIKVDTDTEGLEQLTKEFNQQLEKMGKQQIVFSEKTIQGIVAQFANAVVEGMASGIAAASGKVDVGQIGNKIGNSISEGIKDGVADASRSIMEQLNVLQKRKHELHEQSKQLDKTYDRYEKLAEISSMDYDEFKPLPLSANEDIDEQAHRIMGEFIKAEDALEAATRGTKEYNAALVKAIQSASNLYRMSHTLNDNKNLVKDKTLLSDYSFMNLSDLTADVFDKADVDFSKILRGLDKTYQEKIKAIRTELAQLDAQIQSLQQQNADVVNQEKAKAGLKTLKDIESAYDRISKKGKSAEKAKDRIMSAIEYEPGTESLAVLRNNYNKSLSSNEDWEMQYQWLVKFVKEYDDYSAKIAAETDADKRRNMKQKQRRYTELYEELKPIATNAETSLRDVLGMAGVQAPARAHGNVGATPDDVANADKIAQAAEQKRLADEASAEANRKAADEAEREQRAKEKLSAIQDSDTGDTLAVDVDAEQAEAEQQRLEKERLETEKLALQQDNEAKLKAANEEKIALQNDLDIANEQIKIAQDAEFAARARADETDLKLIEKDAVIQKLEEQLAKAPKETVESKGSVDTEELKNVLNAITYNVKVVQDTEDGDNKIAIDETSLEATLSKVFANILNPQTQQNDLEQTEKHWALESTLQTVKGVIDNIYTNTSKIGTVEVPNVDTIAGTVLDGRLTEIKSVLESIDNKIAKGGVIATRGAVKQANTQPVEPAVREQAARSNMIKSLINDYKTMGKLAAQFASDGNLETKAILENLKAEISRKRESLKLTMDENSSLREKYSIAFDAEKRLLLARKAQERIDDNDKDIEKAWKKQVKDAQRATGINAATTAANAGDQSVLRTIGTEGISNDIEQKAKELSTQIKALRVLRDEINNKGEKASDKDRDNLSKQIAKVKELKTEIDSYLKIHEKYSGQGVIDLGDASNFGAVGTDEYWNNITAAVKNAATGRVTIKGLNADTGELTGTTKIAANTFAQWSAVVDPMTGRLSILRTGIKKTETLIEQITRKTKEIFTYFSGSSIIFKFFNELRRGIQYVRDIDLALTELKKVTDETEETYDKFLQTAAKTGARLGTTISAVTEATATFAKLGYSMEQASKMAEAAIVYKNVGDNIASTGDAADSIISTLKGFGLEASQAMSIIDKFNEVGNRFAITSQGIGEALRLSASALNEGGNSLDESIAIITAANEVVNDPSSVGTALKTLTLRLRGSKTELEEMGEDVSDMATTTSQLQAKLLALTGGKVDIMLDENTFKNSTQILREMAAAWEDMNDIQRASALELMGGKRQANVLSALIQNFDTVESVIETSANSAGSALKENERYLDSIQGKVDQFTNATQAMWSNALDSDMVKGIVSLGTAIIKVIDKVGLLNSALIALATISMVKNKMGPLTFFTELFNGLKNIPGKIKSLISGFTGVTAATSAYTAETLAASVANGTLSASEAASIATKNGLTLATTNLTAAEAAEMLTKSGMSKVDALALVSKLGLSTATSALTAETVKATMASAGYTPVQIAAATAALFGAGANTTLAASFMALWTAMWPVLVVMLAMAAVVGIVKLFDAMVTTTSELQEELNEMKSSLSDVRSELDSVNQELETTNERMSELLAKDNLTFVEQEELDKLKEMNAELERKKDMLEAQEAYERERVGRQAAEVVNSKRTEVGWWLNGKYEEEEVYDDINDYLAVKKEIEEIEKKLANKNLSSDEREDLNEELKDLRADLDSEKLDVTEYIDVLTEALSGVEYGDSAESDAALDYYHELLGYWNVQQGTPNAKSNEIKSIFNKKEFSDTQTAIEQYVEALGNGDKSAADSIANIIKNNKDLVQDLEARGLEAQDAIDYFINLGSEANYATIEGKIKEVDEATKRLKTSLSGFDTSSLDSIQQALTDKGWVDTEGNLISDAIAEYFGGKNGGISEQTRAEIERLVKQIYDGKMSVEDALKSFELFGVQSVIEIQVEAVKTNFKDVFVDLEDADGLIDTFKELGNAIGSTVGALEAFNQAQADVADKGFVSIQTALQLMEYTDDYSSVLEVVDGKLQLVENAEQNLIQARINAIKVSAQTAVADAQAAYDKAELAVQSYRSAMVEEASASTVATAWQKIVAVAAGIKNALDNIWSGESIGDLYNSGYNAYLESATGYKTTYDDAGLQALEDALSDADTKLKEAQGNAEIANALTADNLEDVFKSSDSNTTDKVENDLFQKEMDYWENRIAANQAKYEQLQNEIDLLEAKGQKADVEFYEEQIQLENERKWLLEQQKAEAQAFLDTLEEGSEEWWEVANTLNDIEGELDDVTASIVDLQDAIGEIDTYVFEEFNTRLDNLTSKLETIRNLIAPDGEEDWFDDEGNWTEAGVSVLGSHIQELEMYKQGYQETMDELAKYEPDYEGNKSYYESLGIHSEQEYYNKTEELISQQYDFAESISDTEQSVVDMYESSIDAVEEYIDTLIDGYNDYIDSVKEALDAERELYDFKKNVQKQAKDIAELERRIMSLSGSTNAADIAERRKLEAQLYESRESLNDAYYDHAKESQNEALDAEQTAYEESMTRFVEGLRVSLERATINMDEFLMGVTSMVMYNADTVLAKYEETNLPLTTELTNPWIKAKEAVGTYSGDALDLMNQWMKSGGFFEQFNASGTTNLTYPWSAGAAATITFKNSVSSAMADIANSVRSNVSNITSYLGSVQSAYNAIISTAQRAKAEVESANAAASAGASYTGSASTSQSTSTTPSHVDDRILSKYKLTASQVLDLGYGPISLEEFERLLKNYQIKYSAAYKQVANTRDIERSLKKVMYGEYVTGPLAVRQYAKGTPGTKRDGFAITDESWIGEEITLAAGKNGQLQYLKKGSSVLPADISANLIEWGKLDPNMLDITNPTANINMITNAINKPEIIIDVENFLKVERVDKDTLPQLEAMMDKKIDTFAKQLNYSVKKFTR